MNEDHIGCLFSLVVLVFVIIISYWITKAVWEADIPMWVKILILK